MFNYYINYTFWIVRSGLNEDVKNVSWRNYKTPSPHQLYVDLSLNLNIKLLYGHQ